jgi:TrmH family RNA methyltransferase
MKRLFKNQIKLINSLQNKKNRIETGLFAVEGIKAVSELLKSNIRTQFMVFDPAFNSEEFIAANSTASGTEFYLCDITSVSSMCSSEGILAVAEMPAGQEPDTFFSGKKTLLGLFGISDPGNLGTLIRTACWFGIDGILLFDECADIFSAKVIRGSMGAVFLIDILNCGDYNNTSEFLNDWTKIGTFLDEKSSFTFQADKKMILFLGNESSGLDSSLKKVADMNFRIDSAGKFDSLNVSVAGGIIMNEIINIGRKKC